MLSLIREIFAMAVQMLSLLTWLVKAVRPLYEGAGAPELMAVYRLATIAGYKKSIAEFYSWCEARGVVLTYVYELDRAALQYAAKARLSRGYMERLFAALEATVPS